MIPIAVRELGEPGLVDIFWGDGWHNHSRVRIENTPGARPNFKHVSGFGLPWNVRNAVIRQLRLG